MKANLRNMEFELEKHEFIELNKLLKLLGWAESGGEANNLITDGLVKVNGEMELRKRKKLIAGDVVSFENQSVIVK